MSRIISNFFEFQFESYPPPVYVLDKKNVKLLSTKDTYLSLNQDSVITFTKIPESRLIDGENLTYVCWLMNKYLHRQIVRSDHFFDINRFKNQFTIQSNRLHQEKEYSILRRCTWQIINFDKKLYLVLTPKLKYYNRLTLKMLIEEYNFNSEYIKKYVSHGLAYVEVNNKRQWVEAQINDVLDEVAKIEIPFIYKGSINVALERVIPKLNSGDFESFPPVPNSIKKISQIVKNISVSSKKKELDISTSIIKNYLEPIFEENDLPFSVNLKISPLEIPNQFISKANLQLEPDYKIERQNISFTSKKLMQGLSRVNINSDIEEKNVVVFFTKDTKKFIKDCILKLNNGITKGNFSFSLPNKFGVKLNVIKHYEVDSINNYLDQIQNFLISSEEELKSSLVLIYLPENSNLYYPIKALLAFNGRISQVISKKEFDIYSAWNLSANLFAKFGGTPWSIDDSKKQTADLVLGLSYSALNYKGNLKRNIGYVNVFDRKGIWRFMKSNTHFLDFEKRNVVVPNLVSESVKDYLSTEADLETIDIHYTKKFSKEERIGIYNKIKELKPQIEEINFVSINSTHPLKIFDLENPNLKFGRGGIIYTGSNEFLLSISENSAINKILKVTVWSIDKKEISKERINAIALRIIIMSKINWKSVVRETNEPVTTKFSGEIAKMTNFFGLTEWKDVNNQLSNLPWFI